MAKAKKRPAKRKAKPKTLAQFLKAYVKIPISITGGEIECYGYVEKKIYELMTQEISCGYEVVVVDSSDDKQLELPLKPGIN